VDIKTKDLEVGKTRTGEITEIKDITTEVEDMAEITIRTGHRET